MSRDRPLVENNSRDREPEHRDVNSVLYSEKNDKAPGLERSP